MGEDHSEADLARYLAFPLETYYRMGWSILTALVGMNVLAFGAGLYAGIHWGIK